MPSQPQSTQEYPAPRYHGLLSSLIALGRPTFLPSSCVESVATTHLVTHGQGVHRGCFARRDEPIPLYKPVSRETFNAGSGMPMGVDLQRHYIKATRSRSQVPGIRFRSEMPIQTMAELCFT